MQCESLERAIPALALKGCLKDVDGSETAVYIVDGQEITVHNSYYIGALFIDTEMDLDKYFVERYGENGVSYNFRGSDMKDWTPEAIEYWNDRASEPLRFESYPDDICDAINRKHPLPSEDEIWEIIRESQNG